MAYADFPEDKVIKTVDTAEIVPFGTFVTPDSAELKHIQAHFYISGTNAGSEGFRLRVHTTSDTSVIYAASDWVDFSQLVDPPAANSLQWVRFDFNNEGLNLNYTYTISLELRNYTRNADIFYVGVVYDWPLPTYLVAGNNPTDQSLGFKVFVEKELDV